MSTITDALRAARACIHQDRTSLADTGMRPDNTMEPDAAAGVADYDAVLQQIDAALAAPQGEPVAASLSDIVALWDLDAPLRYNEALHMQAKRALAGEQPASPNLSGWCVYVAGMISGWLDMARPQIMSMGDEARTKAIAGIIERRLWAMPKDPAPAPAVPSDRWLIAAVDAAMVEMKNISPPMRRSECERLICAALTAAPTPPAQGEKLVRFCPGCGSVGDVPDTFRDCCPDGSNARMIPEDLATRCHDLFLLALAGAKAQQPAVPESADSDEEAQAPTIDIKAAAGRLMGWPLPKDFSPDNGIRFTPPDFGWPTGTNLLNVTQAEQMLAYALGTTAPAVPEDVARDMPARPWPKARDVGRLGDMSPRAHLRVGLDSDNDVYVSVADDEGHGSVEFCTGSGGGGSSMRTRDALIALMVAMEADNAERPDKDWWARRMGGKAAEKGGA